MYAGRSGWLVILVFGGTALVRYLSYQRRRAGRNRPGSPGAGRSFTAGPGGQASGPREGAGAVEPTTGVGTAAGWFTDPFVRHEQRYWSGTAWTEHVSDAGVPGIDPPPERPTR